MIVDDEANSVANAFGLSAFPFWVVTDSSGTVIGRTAGALGLSDFENLVRDVAGN